MSLQSSWQDFAAWLRNLKLPSIDIDHDYLNDTITVRNRDTMKNQRISRFVLEGMDDETRKEVFTQMIANTMKNPAEIVQDQLRQSQEKADADTLNRITGWITAPATPGTITSGVYSGGGAGGIAMPIVNAGSFGNMIRGAIGAPAYVDDYYARQEEELQKDLLKTKLFTANERQLLTAIKENIIRAFHQNRADEETFIPFTMHKIVIAGGCFASLINDEPINDIDVFLLDDEYNHMLAKGMADSYSSDEPVILTRPSPLSGSLTLNSRKHSSKKVKIGNSNYMNNDKIEQTVYFKDSKMQYITTKYKTREELINHFDFRHCCVSYEFATDKLFITREVFDLIKNKRLLQNTIKRPAHWRYEKFHARGWKEEINLVDDLMTL